MAEECQKYPLEVEVFSFVSENVYSGDYGRRLTLMSHTEGVTSTRGTTHRLLDEEINIVSILYPVLNKVV